MAMISLPASIEQFIFGGLKNGQWLNRLKKRKSKFPAKAQARYLSDKTRSFKNQTFSAPSKYLSLEFYSHRRRLQTEQKRQFWFLVKKEIGQKNGLQGDQIQRFCSVLPLFQRFWRSFRDPKMALLDYLKSS